jgi:hypothetical protein
VSNGTGGQRLELGAYVSHDGDQVSVGFLSALEVLIATDLFEVEGGLVGGVRAEVRDRAFEAVSSPFEIVSVAVDDGVLDLSDQRRIVLKEQARDLSEQVLVATYAFKG